VVIFAGVDAYPRGWLALRCSFDRKGRMEIVSLEGHRGFASVVALPDHLIVVDVPIGLVQSPGDGPRLCDVEARRLLRTRGASVFPAPTRAALNAGSFAAAKAVGPINLQTFGILRKVADVDGAMRPAMQARVREGHPELSFREMANGAGALRTKTSAEGNAQRARLLAKLGLDVDQLLARRPPGADVDDVLDAAAMAWTAARIGYGQAHSIPADAPCDAKGLRMEIWV
jgi:predicted RNase H-like nuclease